LHTSSKEYHIQCHDIGKDRAFNATSRIAVHFNELGIESKTREGNVVNAFACEESTLIVRAGEAVALDMLYVRRLTNAGTQW
jgi:hypothetical protein